ncbi:MAG: dTDP-4-dehydrorhamnose reductase [Planctomycetota bacterium]|nr:dTDP-4-dehydrorhamnose reductase [Planctomycetota bacterium]
MDSNLGTVIVTGANGQLGTPLCERLSAKGYTVVPLTREELELTDPEAILRVLESFEAHTIYHCAAMTAVDDCETQQDLAYAVNSIGTQTVCRAALRMSAKVIYVSTDYVFDGLSNEGYDEFDDTNPRSIYGRSKFFGEKAVLASSPENIVVRVSWLFGPAGRNFVSAIIDRARSGKELKVVADQRGLPTYAPHLADKMIEITESKLAGVVHVTGTGNAVTWLDFARSALKLANIDHPTSATTARDYGLPAPRPNCSILHSRVLPAFGIALCPPWLDGLSDFVEQYPAS